MNESESPTDNDMTFSNFLLDYRSKIGLISKLGLFIPALLPFYKVVTYIGPPWPLSSSYMMCLFVAIVQFIVLIHAFDVGYESGSIERNRKRMNICLIVLVIASTGYFACFSLWNVAVDGNENRVIVGYEFRDSALAERCAQKAAPRCTALELLEDHEGKPDLVWTKRSLLVTRMMTFLSWWIAWAMFSAYVAFFVCIKWRRERSRRQRS